MAVDKKKNIRFSHKNMTKYYKEFKDEGYADQTMKNIIHKFKKEGRYTLYLAAMTAYNRIKLERSLPDDEV